MSCLEEQSELCRRLESSRDRRRSALARARRSPADLPEVVLDALGEEAGQTALDRWFDAARAAQHEIDLNREFYGVALAAIEDAVRIITDRAPKTYDPRGREVASAGRPMVSTSL